MAKKNQVKKSAGIDQKKLIEMISRGDVEEP